MKFPACLLFAALAIPSLAQNDTAPARPPQNNPGPMNAGAARRESALVPAYEAQKAHDYETAYQLFKQAIPDFPGDLRVITLAAGAARDAGHLEESLALYQQILQNDRYYANRQLPNVIQLDAALGRWQEFDDARKTAHTAALAGDKLLSAKLGYIIEDYTDGTRHIQVLEFPTAYGRFHTRYRFRILSATDPATHFTPYLDLESDDGDQILFRQQHPDKAANGERLYSLDTYPKPNTQGLMRFYEGEPTYEEVRAVVFAKQPQAPTATTTINPQAPKPIAGAQSVNPCTPSVTDRVTPGQVFGIRNAPFSATGKMTIDQKLPDGNIIHAVNPSRMARDSAGRTRMERVSRCWRGPDGEFHAAWTVSVSDGIAKTSMTWPVDELAPKVARVTPFRMATQQPLTPEEIAQQKKIREINNPPKDELLIEDLGTKNINGVSAEGTRTTRKIRAGEEGNNRALETVDEVWNSKQLAQMVMTINDDPRNGHTEFALENVSLQEPDASLFAPPPGYRVEDVKPVY